MRPWPFAKRLALRSVKELLDDLGPHLAASIAYRTLFSLVPLAIVLTVVASAVLSVTGQEADVVDTMVRNVPLDAEGKATLRDVLEGATSDAPTVGFVGLVGLLALVWGASGMMGAIRTGLNAAWDVEDARPFVRGKLVDLTLVFGTAALVLLSFVVSITVRVTERHVPEASGTTGALLGVVPPLVLAFVAVVFLYRVVPATGPELRDVWPAALLVAIAFVAMQSLLGIYFQNFASYNAIYGSLGAVFGFLVFVYAASLVFLLGAEAAAEWPRVRAELAAPARQPRGPH